MQSRQYSINLHFPVEKLNYSKLELVIEEIASKGCIAVNKLLHALKKQQVPAQLSAYSAAERSFIYHELKSVMAVYEDGICHL
jgi:hypothetical protein